MAILIINRFSSNKVNYYELLHPLNQQLLLLTNQAGFDDTLYHYIEVMNHLTDSRIEETVSKLINKYKIQHVIALSELDLYIASKIRERLNIKGQGVKSAVAYRDKVIMKDYAKSSVNVPVYKRIKALADIYRFIEVNGYPVVIKPVDGAGSANTHILFNLQMVEELILNTDLIGFEIEEYIEGEMYKVDGLFKDGKIVLSWPSKYINDCLSFKDGKQATYIQLEPSNKLYERLINFCKRLLTSLPTPIITTFHAEIIHTKDDQLVLCEVASRTGGGGVAEVSELIYNINITDEWVKGQVNLPTDIPIVNTDKLYGVVLIPPKEKRLLSIPACPKNDWIERYIPEGIIGQKYTKARNSVYYVLMVIISGNSEMDLLKKMDMITELLEDLFIWEENEELLIT